MFAYFTFVRVSFEKSYFCTFIDSLALVSVLVNLQDTSFNSHFCFCNYYFIIIHQHLSVILLSHDQKLLTWNTWGHWNNSYITKVMWQIYWPMRNKRFADISKELKTIQTLLKMYKMGLNLIFFLHLYTLISFYVLDANLLFWLALFM